MDLIPGQPGVMMVQADEPGIYRGECAQFCGPPHGRMSLKVVVLAPLEFERWREDRIATAPRVLP